MKTLPLLLIAATLLTSSCYYRDDSAINIGCTENCMTFNVKVTTGEGSTAPLANTLVELGWSESSMFTSNGRLIGRGVTAADGSISFSFKAKEEELQSGKYYIKAQRGGGYIGQFVSFFNIKQANLTTNVNVHVPCTATLKIVYKNFKPTNANDSFGCTPYYSTYTQNTSNIAYSSSVSLVSRSYYGIEQAFERTEITNTTAGNQYTYLSITRRKNGITTNTLDSIFVGRGQTKTYEIEY